MLIEFTMSLCAVIDKRLHHFEMVSSMVQSVYETKTSMLHAEGLRQKFGEEALLLYWIGFSQKYFAALNTAYSGANRAPAAIWFSLSASIRVSAIPDAFRLSAFAPFNSRSPATIIAQIHRCIMHLLKFFQQTYFDAQLIKYVIWFRAHPSSYNKNGLQTDL